VFVIYSILPDGKRPVGEAWPAITFARLAASRQLKIFRAVIRFSTLRMATRIDSA
jgi:hypothetical protein